jgi:hypothetical protein
MVALLSGCGLCHAKRQETTFPPESKESVRATLRARRAAHYCPRPWRSAFEHSVDVGRSSENTFALPDDFGQTPKLLARCTELAPVAPGPHSVGTKLRYHYKEAGRTGVMDGETTARIPNERLTMKYEDDMM